MRIFSHSLVILYQNPNKMSSLFFTFFHFFLVGRVGVEPTQSQTADLQSVGLATCSVSPKIHIPFLILFQSLST